MRALLTERHGSRGCGFVLALILLGGAALAVRLLLWFLPHLRGFLGVLGLASALVFTLVTSQFLFSAGLAATLAILLVAVGGTLGASVAALRTPAATLRRWMPFAGILVSLVLVASVLTEGYEEGWKEKLRNGFWGFSPEDYPINGRVWLPVGEGPFRWC